MNETKTTTQELLTPKQWAQVTEQLLNLSSRITTLNETPKGSENQNASRKPA